MPLPRRAYLSAVDVGSDNPSGMRPGATPIMGLEMLQEVTDEDELERFCDFYYGSSGDNYLSCEYAQDRGPYVWWGNYSNAMWQGTSPTASYVELEHFIFQNQAGFPNQHRRNWMFCYADDNDTDRYGNFEYYTSSEGYSKCYVYADDNDKNKGFYAELTADGQLPDHTRSTGFNIDLDGYGNYNMEFRTRTDGDIFGVFGKSPVVQQGPIANATDVPSAISALNQALAAMRAYGWLQ